MADEAIANKIDITQQLMLNTPVPVFTAGFNRLLQAFEADHINHLKLAQIIADFPSIAARLLFLANSAWASPRVPVENLDMACARLGFSLIRSVSVSLYIGSSVESLNRCAAFDAKYFWCSSLLTAEAATLLVSATTEATIFNASTLHTAGLLHNLGLLWLAGNWPEHTSRALMLAAENDSLPIREALRSIIGVDHCEVGGILGRSWKLPEVLISAMEQHSSDVYSSSAYPSTVLVGYAAELVSALQRDVVIRPGFPQTADIKFDSTALDEIYSKLRGKLTETQDLADTMFSF